MNVLDFPSADLATDAAADLLAQWLASADTRNIMVAGGNTPLGLYARIARRSLDLAHLRIFMLDEYVGVPEDEPRNCANLLRRAVVQAWAVPENRYHTIRSSPDAALPSILAHEKLIETSGGLDVVVLGLGQNGHLGFNEPGSTADSGARLVPLQPVSIEANRTWFEGRFAPDTGVTVGMKTLLAARRVLVLAFGSHKRAPVQSMVEGPSGPECPASLLRSHPATWLLVDAAAASGLRPAGPATPSPEGGLAATPTD